MDETPSNSEGTIAAEGPMRLEYASPEAQAHFNGLGTASAVCAVLSVAGLCVACAGEFRSPTAVLVLLLPPSAVVLGIVARRSERRRGVTPSHRAFAGLVLGWIEITLLLVVFLMLNSMGRSREPAQRVMCASNLRQIGMLMLVYANSNAGRYPPTVEDVLLGGDVSAECLTCPTTSDSKATGPTTQAVIQQIRTQKGHLSYVYTAASLTSSSTRDHILAYEPLTNHFGAGSNVLLGDGTVTWLDKAEATHVIAELQAGYNPPRPRTKAP